MNRIFLSSVGFVLACLATAQAGWLDRSDKYLADCQREAQHRYYATTSSFVVRRHAHLCMLAHGYLYRETCDEGGWLNANCYRLRYKWEGR